ncbi:ATP-binding protein [Alphaproteobacteria bacterium KMM 3653]|uniref:ATP-binding protein n=1 Tax=Harenicola maris TaxID=2841044 RepID=A0AAP2G705_9RHOB|nr:ATP-binding protein [Harenicola maris]
MTSYQAPVLHLVCGKIASGKSTLCAQLGAQDGAVVLSEDDWLAGLYGEQMTSLSDYVRCMGRLRGVIGPHIVALLRSGLTVVLDFQANTVESRAWMRGLVEEAGVDHLLHLLEVPDAVCIARLHARNAAGEHPFAASEAQFHQISGYFTAPSEEEGFQVLHHGAEG